MIKHLELLVPWLVVVVSDIGQNPPARWIHCTGDHLTDFTYLYFRFVSLRVLTTMPIYVLDFAKLKTNTIARPMPLLEPVTKATLILRLL